MIDTVLLLFSGAMAFLTASGIAAAYLAVKVDPIPPKPVWVRTEFGRWTR